MTLVLDAMLNIKELIGLGKINVLRAVAGILDIYKSVLHYG